MNLTPPHKQQPTKTKNSAPPPPKGDIELFGLA